MKVLKRVRQKSCTGQLPVFTSRQFYEDKGLFIIHLQVLVAVARQIPTKRRGPSTFYHCFPQSIFINSYFSVVLLKKLMNAKKTFQLFLIEAKDRRLRTFPRTVFENHRKRLIQDCERSELRYSLSGQVH